MADFSVLSPEVLKEHPDWAMIDSRGKPYEYNVDAGVYAAHRTP
jgi:hypothetical protein